MDAYEPVAVVRHQGVEPAKVQQLAQGDQSQHVNRAGLKHEINGAPGITTGEGALPGSSGLVAAAVVAVRK